MTTPLGSQFRDLPTIRLDDQPLDAQWRAPRRRGDDFGTAHKVLVLLAVLVVVLGGIWAGHGFDRRTDRVKAYAPGARLDLKAFTLVLTTVEVTRNGTTGIGSKPNSWKIVGRGRATSKAPQAVLLDKMGLVRTAGGYTVTGELRTTPTAEPSMNAGYMLEPGLADVPVVITAELPKEWVPTDHLYVGAYEMGYGPQPEAWSNDHKSWRRGSVVHGGWLPVLQLPGE